MIASAGRRAAAAAVRWQHVGGQQMLQRPRRGECRSELGHQLAHARHGVGQAAASGGGSDPKTGLCGVPGSSRCRALALHAVQRRPGVLGGRFPSVRRYN